MEKEFLDFLYDQRSDVQGLINNAVLSGKQPLPQCCDNMIKVNPKDLEIEALRGRIYGLNMAIDKYLKLHPYKR